MEKSTKSVIIGIGIISILSGVYGYFSGSKNFDIFLAFFIGASLIGSIYFDKGEASK